MSTVKDEKIIGLPLVIKLVPVKEQPEYTLFDWIVDWSIAIMSTALLMWVLRSIHAWPFGG